MIGQLSERVAVHKKIRVSNGRGGWTTSEEQLGVFWASVQPLDFRQRTEFQKLDTHVDTILFFRLNADIDVDCFAVYEGKTYTFQAVELPLKHGNFMKVIATGVNENG